MRPYPGIFWPGFCALLLAATGPAWADGSPEPTGESRLLRDASDGRLDEHSLLQAVLIANGLDAADELLRFQKVVDDAVDAMAPRLVPLQAPRSRAAALFELMHERLLRGRYQADCTQLTRTLADGDYNCVSATVLFHVLCRRFGLNPVAVSTPTHVYSRLFADGQAIDIQTTCPTWFALNAEQRAALTPAPSNETREITDLELVARVFYNRGVRCLESERFEQAEASFRKSLILDPRDATSRDNLLATLNNWALDCCDRQQFEQALRLLERGRRIDDQYAAFHANELHTYQRWAQQHCREGDFAAALAVLSAGARRRPDDVLFRDGPVAVYRMWAQTCEKRGDVPAAVELLTRALQEYPQQPDLQAERERLESQTVSLGQASN